MTMTKILLASAVGVVVMQLLFLRAPDEQLVTIYYLAPVAALCIFLLGLATGARGIMAPSSMKALSLAGGLALVAWSAPAALSTPGVELAVHLVGAAALLSVVVWLGKRRWQQSHARAILVVVGGTFGCIEFGHALLARYAAHAQSASIGISEIAAWATELTIVFTVGGLLALFSGLGGKQSAA
jgi:hypothetical protein